jgi:hypothetical protein
MRGTEPSVTDLMEKRLAAITQQTPPSPTRCAPTGNRGAGDGPIADGLLAWLGGQPNVGLR